MQTKIIAVIVLALVSVSSAEQKKALQVETDDTVKTILERSAGQTVGLRVGSGEELRGKVVKVGDDVVHLSELAGRDSSNPPPRRSQKSSRAQDAPRSLGARLFDAVVPLDAIDAVIVRARSRVDPR